MADYQSSLPVRTENNGDVVAQLVDGTVTTQKLAIDAAGKITVKLDDAAGTGITSQVNGAQQALDVGINVAGVQIDPRQVRALTATDVVTANQGAPNTTANAWPVKPTDGTNSQSYTAAGEAKVDITQPLPAGTNAIGTVNVSNLPTTLDTNYGAVGASTIRTASEIGNATGAANFGNGATGAQTLRVAANLAVAGADVTASNPVPVTIEESPGVHVNDYKDASAIAAGSSDNHDYTVTAGKTLHFNQVEGAGSGKLKAVVQVETAVASGVFNAIFTKFNSTADPNFSIIMSNDVVVAAGVRVRVTLSNNDKAAQDLYSTICGYEV